MTLIVRALRRRVGRSVTAAQRAAPGPMLARLAVFGFAGLALGLALPPGILVSRYAPVLVAVALLPAIAPRSWLVTGVILTVAVGWVVTSLLYSEVANVIRLISLTAVLYLLHATAALAAVLPYDAVVRASVFLPWGARAVGVAAASAGLGVFALNGSAILGERSYLIASVLGVAVAGCLVGLLARLR
ncbi:MAG TPA: hypothetical protein VK453_10695 [Micromonosporaceae bacterium]|nr:hypothetical protein [Micromonosporaceae bacterium]